MSDTDTGHPAPIMAVESDLPEGFLPGSVCIGYLSGSDVSNDFLMSLIQTKELDTVHDLGRLNHRHWWINQRSGVNVSRPRNTLVSNFLAMRDPAPEWLLMVDADMRWQPGALESLVRAANDSGQRVIGGLCIAFGRDASDPTKTSLMSTVFDTGDPMPGIGMPPFKVLAAKDVKRNALRECYGTGAAFLLVHRQVFVDIAVMMGELNPWFREVQIRDARGDEPQEGDTIDLSQRSDYWVSEDLFFCLQCHNAGHRIFVHTGVEIQHVKSVRLTESLWRSYGRVVESA